jgi:hypothetical protein
MTKGRIQMHTEKANYANTATGGFSGALRSSGSKNAMRLRTSTPSPVWFAALVASDCWASGDGSEHPVDWVCEAGRALYTNCQSHTEWIEPLGVRLHVGDTVSVTWTPGETAYTVEILHTLDCVA